MLEVRWGQCLAVLVFLLFRLVRVLAAHWPSGHIICGEFDFVNIPLTLQVRKPGPVLRPLKI